MWVLYFVPKNLLSFMVGRLVRVRWPQPLGTWLVQWFIKRYNIDMSEAEKDFYPSIGDLFTRRLKSGLRSVSSTHYVHPSDSTLTIIHPIKSDYLIQAKDKSYSLKKFIEGTDQELRALSGGVALTYYLCPTDHHRVHSPVDGEVESSQHIPGRLWPVNPWSVENISQLFSINERVIVRFQTPRGPLVLIMVGATNVGQITLSFEPQIITNSHLIGSIHRPTRINYSSPHLLKKGDELGTFHMGSTVVVLAAKGVVGDVFSFYNIGAKPPFKVKWGEGFLEENSL